MIHRIHPGLEMKSLRHAAQVFGHILTVARLGAIEDEGASIMSLALYIFRHVGERRIGRWMLSPSLTLFLVQLFEVTGSE